MTTATNLSELTGAYVIDASHSRIGFVARHAMVTKVRGAFNEFDGKINIDGDKPENTTPETCSRLRAATTGPMASMRDGMTASASAPRSGAPGNAKATTRHPCRRAWAAIRAGRAPAPHISPSERITS